MPWTLSRRLFLSGCGASLLGCAPRTRSVDTPLPVSDLARIEARIGGRLGVCVASAGRTLFSHRADERFAMCSTFKWTLAAAVFRAAEEARLDLKQEVAFGANDLLDYSPVTRTHEGRMTVEALADAAVVASDNTAANLLLACIGGPSGLSQFFRSLGDPVTRLDRCEPELNTNLPGDPRDTTSPAAMVHLLRIVLTADTLSPAHREQLISWMVESRTGAQRLRAGLPHDWRVGDKTGTGHSSAVNDVAIAWPPGREPVLISVYLSESQSSLATLNAALAEIGRLVASRITSYG